MRNLFFKIFVIFWIAQSLIFAISTALIVHHHFESPDVLFDGLHSSLENDAQRAVAAYESGGCTAFSTLSTEIDQHIALKDAAGNDLCNPLDLPLPAAISQYPARITSDQVGQQFIWRVPVASPRDKPYVFLLARPHVERQHSLLDDLVHFASPTLPVAIVVGGFTTFVLVILFTRPIVRLRKAARELAEGNLKARVPEPAVKPRPSGDELHALLHDFNHMADRLESLVGAQQLLLRDVSHELRSPLARLSVALELAREDASAQMAKHLDRMERESEKLNQLIGQLLTLSSMEAIENIDRFEPVSLNQVVEQMIPDARYEAGQRQCRVELRADNECVIQGNRNLLYRAIENVLRNAVKYTSAGSKVEIHVASERDEAGNRVSVVEVSDRGPGIPEAEIEAIFRPFYRIDRARSQETGGFGVGLAIAERAVKLHRGKVSGRNRSGGGAVIRMQFPCKTSP
jgi:two-component system, OmpR family, sensor histidine kinase CpxA